MRSGLSPKMTSVFHGVLVTLVAILLVCAGWMANDAFQGNAEAEGNWQVQLFDDSDLLMEWIGALPVSCTFQIVNRGISTYMVFYECEQ